jgi:adenylate cyclase, class 2
MGMEIEAKMKVPDLASVREKLETAGGRRSGKVLETNSFFDTPELSLRSSDRGLRIRVAVDETGKSACTVTMKGPVQGGQFKSRQETEFSADDAQAVRRIFENLGYHFTLSFQKRRESWTLGGCKVELDEVPRLGTYVEIEGDSENTIEAVRRSLAMDQLPPVKTSYISMLWRYLEEHQIKDRQIGF